MLRLEGFGVDFLSIWGPKLDPGGGPRAHFWSLFSVLELSWEEDGPRVPQGRFLGRFWYDFGRFFNAFLVLLPLHRGTVAEIARRAAG